MLLTSKQMHAKSIYDYEIPDGEYGTVIHKSSFPTESYHLDSPPRSVNSQNPGSGSRIAPVNHQNELEIQAFRKEMSGLNKLVNDVRATLLSHVKRASVSRRQLADENAEHVQNLEDLHIREDIFRADFKILKDELLKLIDENFRNINNQKSSDGNAAVADLAKKISDSNDRLKDILSDDATWSNKYEKLKDEFNKERLESQKLLMTMEKEKDLAISSNQIHVERLGADIESLKTALSSSEKEVNTVTERKKVLEKSIVNLSKKISAITREVEIYKAQVSQIPEAQTFLKDVEIEDLKKEKTVLEKSLAIANLNLGQADQKLIKAEEDRKALNAEIQDLQHSVGRESELKMELEMKNKSFMESANLAQARLNAANDRYDKYKSDQEVAIKEKEMEIITLNEKLRTALNSQNSIPPAPQIRTSVNQISQTIANSNSRGNQTGTYPHHIVNSSTNRASINQVVQTEMISEEISRLEKEIDVLKSSLNNTVLILVENRKKNELLIDRVRRLAENENLLKAQNEELLLQNVTISDSLDRRNGKTNYFEEKWMRKMTELLHSKKFTEAVAVSLMNTARALSSTEEDEAALEDMSKSKRNILKLLATWINDASKKLIDSRNSILNERNSLMEIRNTNELNFAGLLGERNYYQGVNHSHDQRILDLDVESAKLSSSIEINDIMISRSPETADQRRQENNAMSNKLEENRVLRERLMQSPIINENGELQRIIETLRNEYDKLNLASGQLLERLKVCENEKKELESETEIIRSNILKITKELDNERKSHELVKTELERITSLEKSKSDMLYDVYKRIIGEYPDNDIGQGIYESNISEHMQRLEQNMRNMENELRRTKESNLLTLSTIFYKVVANDDKGKSKTTFNSSTDVGSAVQSYIDRCKGRKVKLNERIKELEGKNKALDVELKKCLEKTSIADSDKTQLENQIREMTERYNFMNDKYNNFMSKLSDKLGLRSPNEDDILQSIAELQSRSKIQYVEREPNSPHVEADDLESPANDDAMEVRNTKENASGDVVMEETDTSINEATERVHSYNLRNRRDVFEVDAIVDMRMDGNVRKYRVRWKGFDKSRDLWLTEEDLRDAPDVLRTFKRINRI